MNTANTKSISAQRAEKRYKDIIGKQFGKLIIIGLGKVQNQRRYALCKCGECGNIAELRMGDILYGRTKSCCRRWTAAITHGMKKTRFYQTWSNLKKRMENPLTPSYKYYGGRGLKVSKSWKSFNNFKDDMLESYIKHVEDYGIKNTQIDRINNDKGYEKSNCRWATIKEQANNKRK